MLTISDQDKIRYGADKDQGRAKFSLAMLLARNTLAADADSTILMGLQWLQWRKRSL